MAGARWFPETRAGAPDRRGALWAGLALGAGALGAAALLLGRDDGLPDPADPATSLEAMERAVFRAHPGPELTAGELAARLALAPAAFRVFDLRPRAEHAAGHIPGAAQVDPFVTPEAFLAAHGATLLGRVVVLTDLVGARSAEMLARLRRAWRRAPPAAGYSLRGGVLRWWAEGRPLAGGGQLMAPPGGWDALADRAVRSRS